MVQVFIGTNVHMVEEAARQAINEFRDQYGDTAIERYDSERLDPNQIQQIVSSLPFLTPKRLIVLKNISAHKVLAETVQSALHEVPETTEVVLIETQPDKRTGFYKFVTKLPGARQFNELDTGQLASWLVTEAAALGGSLQPKDARYLIERIGTSQLQLRQELQKLVTYQPDITQATIELLVPLSPQSSVFNLLDAAFAGDKKTTLRLYGEQRAQRVEPLAIVGMIAWQLHALAVAKAAGRIDVATAAKEAGMSPFVLRKSQSLVRSVTLRTIRTWIDDALELEAKLKTTAMPADDAVQHLLLSFAKD